VVLLIALFGLVSRTARAQQLAGLTLRWDAPARCPQQNDLSERVRKLVGAASSAQAALQAEGTINRSESGRFHLKLVLRAGGLASERELESRSCADLTRAAAVAIALLLRPEEAASDGAQSSDRTGDTAHDNTDPTASPAPVADADRAPPEAKPEASALPPPPHDPVPPRPLPNPPAKAAARGDVRARAPVAALSIGPLPSPQWGVSFAAGVSYASWRLWLEGSEWLRQDLPARAFPGYSARVTRETLALRGCWASRFSALELAPCAVVAVEHVGATGAGSSVTPESQHINWVSVGAGLQGRVYLASWFSLALSADGIIETSRPRLSIAGIGLVDQIGPAAFMLMLGPEWIL
jgi:hypothetical protein